MTTNSSGIKTPWDIAYSELEGLPRTQAIINQRYGLLCKMQGYQAGVLDERARAAALVEALKAADEWSRNLHNHHEDELCPVGCVAQQVVAAIDAYEKEA